MLNPVDLFELQTRFYLLLKLLKIDRNRFEKEYQKYLINEIGAPCLQTGLMKGFVKETYYGKC